MPPVRTSPEFVTVTRTLMGSPGRTIPLAAGAAMSVIAISSSAAVVAE